MFDTYAARRSGPAFVATSNGGHTPFGIDDDAFARWLADESDELEPKGPDRVSETPGNALPELAYRALRAGVLVGDPGIELNIHGATAADETGYIVRLNNLTGCQQRVGLTRGWHELRWPTKGLTPSEEVRFYLQQICDVANTLLNDLVTPF